MQVRSTSAGRDASFAVQRDRSPRAQAGRGVGAAAFLGHSRHLQGEEELLVVVGSRCRARSKVPRPDRMSALAFPVAGGALARGESLVGAIHSASPSRLSSRKLKRYAIFNATAVPRRAMTARSSLLVARVRHFHSVEEMWTVPSLPAADQALVSAPWSSWAQFRRSKTRSLQSPSS